MRLDVFPKGIQKMLADHMLDWHWGQDSMQLSLEYV